MMEWMNRIIKSFFWFAFASFLLASIPHIAYFFRAFEPLVQPGDSQNTFYWVVAYVLALSIDVMVFLLSVTVAQLQRDRAPWQTTLTVYAFIVALSGLSWFINWQYAKEFSSSMLGAVTPINLDFQFFRVNVGTVDPAIASMFQVFAIAYTYIADKIATGKGKTAVELKAEADEAEDRAKEQKRLDGLRKEKRAARVEDAASVVGGVLERVSQARDKRVQQADLLEKVLQFFREQAHLQADDQADLANKMLAQFLNIRPKEADLWRVRAVALLRKEEAEQVEREVVADAGQDISEKLALTVAFFAAFPGGTDEELAAHLGLVRPAVARFWRLKAAELSEQERDALLEKMSAHSGRGFDEWAESSTNDFCEESESGWDGSRIHGGDPAEQNTEKIRIVDIEAAEASAEKKRRSPGATGPRYILFSEAVRITGYSEETLRSYVSAGRIERHPTDKSRLKVSSLRKLPRMKQTEHIPALNLV